MAKTVNRLALQQSLVRNGVAEDPAAGNVADDWGDEIDEVTADLVTKEDLEVFGRELIATVNLRFAEMQADLERRDKARAERESEWWRLQQERDDKWRAEQRERDDKWRAEQRERDEAREKRDEEWRAEQRERDREAANKTSKILWAIFGVGRTLGTIFGIVIAVA